MDGKWFKLALQWRKPSQGRPSNPDEEMMLQAAVVENSLEQVKRNLPMKFLKLKNMTLIARGNAISVLSRIASDTSFARMTDSWHLWVRFRDSAILMHRHTMAQKILRSARLWLTKKNISTTHSVLVTNTTRKIQNLFEVTQQIQSHSTRIFKLLRHCHVMRNATSSKLQEVTARMFQETLRQHHLKRDEVTKLRLLCIQNHAITLLQRHVRGIVARKHVKKQQKLRHNEHFVHTRYLSPLTLISYNFEQQGAAHRIQAWLLTLSSRNHPTYKRDLQQKVLKIQRIIRGQIFVRQIREHACLRRGMIRDIKKNEGAALKIECVIRGHNARVKLQHIRACRGRPNKEYASFTHLQSLHKSKSKTKVIENGIVRLQALLRRGCARKLTYILCIEHVTRTQLSLRQWVKCRLRDKAANCTRACASWLAFRLILHSTLRVRSATYISARWRGFLARSLHFLRRWAMRTIALRLNKYIRCCFWYRHTNCTPKRSCRRAEINMAGRFMFRHSREAEIQHQILVQSNMCEHNHASELQHIFMTYCSYGQKGNTSRLGVGPFSRLMKESKNVMLPSINGISPSDVELTFMKHRSKVNHIAVDSHLHYAEFLAAIEHLANIFFLFPPPSVGKLNEVDAKKCAFLREHLFQSQVAKCHTRSLRSSSCVGRADLKLRASSQKIISAWRIYDSRNISNFQKHHLLFSLSKEEHTIAATSIQRIWRGVIDRSLVSRIVKDTYDLFVDISSGREFWFNKAKLVSRWTRPFVLIGSELESPVFLPRSELIFEVPCALCSRTVVDLYCIECENHFCCNCLSSSHASDRNHNSIELEFCIHCHFQLGTKLCEQCKDVFCDTCFEDQHLMGSLQRHTYNQMVTHCHSCKRYAARKTGGVLKERQVCMQCASDLPQCDIERLCDVPYLPNMAKEQRQQRKASILLERRGQVNKERDFKMRQAATVYCATQIQCAWRGLHSRRVTAEYILERRLWSAQRIADARLRQTRCYQLACFKGRGPLLESDKPRETVMKKIPCWSRKVAGCIIRDRLTCVVGDML